MKWTHFVKDYLSFTRKERIAVVTLLLLILLIWFLPALLPAGNSSFAGTADTAWIAQARKALEKEDETNPAYGDPDERNSSVNYQRFSFDRSVHKYSGGSKGTLFPFDPNTLSAEGWEKLGLRSKTIATIQNYLAKGGHFYKAEDLQRIYGLFDDEYERLAPFVRIESGPPGSGNYTAGSAVKEFRSLGNGDTKPKRYSYAAVDINLADTSAWVALPGIGSKLAARIVSFREKLGGFYAVEQVKEIYGLADSAYQQLKPLLLAGHTPVKKIRLNTAAKEELKQHPYIKWALANAIVEYRNPHGPFTSINDLKKIMLITDEVFEKIRHYLEL
jgi:competence protein ComEA